MSLEGVGVQDSGRKGAIAGGSVTRAKMVLVSATGIAGQSAGLERSLPRHQHPRPGLGLSVLSIYPNKLTPRQETEWRSPQTSTKHRVVCQGCDDGEGMIWVPGSQEYLDHLKERNVCKTCQMHFESTSNLHNVSDALFFRYL